MTIADQIREARSKRLLTVNQFSLLTQYHPQSIYRLIYRGAITIVRVGPRTIRIPQSEVRIVRARHPLADQTLTV